MLKKRKRKNINTFGNHRDRDIDFNGPFGAHPFVNNFNVRELAKGLATRELFIFAKDLSRAWPTILIDTPALEKMNQVTLE